MNFSGRGGAGNYKDTSAETPINKLQQFERNPNVLALKQAQADAEAQEQLAASQRREQPYVPSGRGGAGNIHTPSTLREHETDSAAEVARQRAAAPASSKGSQARIMGRGGAGNYLEGTEGEREDEEKREKVEELRRVAEGDVEIGLAKPGKAFLGNERE